MNKSHLKQLIKEEIFKVLNEEINNNYLYHNTSIENFLSIIKDNFILKSPKGFISFSRNKNMPDQEFNSEFEVKIIIDKNKLQTKYKIKPYVDPLDDHEEDEYTLYSKQSKWFQSEEITKSPTDIKNSIAYIELPDKQKWIENEAQYIKTYSPKFGSMTKTLRPPGSPIPKKFNNMYENTIKLLKKNNISYKIR